MLVEECRANLVVVEFSMTAKLIYLGGFYASQINKQFKNVNF